MGRDAHVWPEPPRRVGDETEVAARVEWPATWPRFWRDRRARLWFRVPGDLPLSEVAVGDAFLLGTLFGAMRRARALHVHAPVGEERIGRLARLQRLWVERKPEKYREVEIRPDSTVPEVPATGPAVLSFSGGLDSAYALHRRTQPGNDETPRVGAALLIAGTDVPVSEAEAYEQAFAKARRLTESRGVPLLRATTTLRNGVRHSWSHGSAAGFGAVLTLFRGRFGAGILASGLTAAEAPGFWPQDTTDPPLVSSSAFPVVADGLETDRFEKMLAVADWPEAYDSLRVCYAPGFWGRNCGECAKCLTTALLARLAWGRVPPFMPRDVGPEDVLRLAAVRHAPTIRLRLEQVQRHAAARGVDEPWVRAIDDAIGPLRPAAAGAAPSGTGRA
jgi:hypothetical protein